MKHIWKAGADRHSFAHRWLSLLCRRLRDCNSASLWFTIISDELLEVYAFLFWCHVILVYKVSPVYTHPLLHPLAAPLRHHLVRETSPLPWTHHAAFFSSSYICIIIFSKFLPLFLLPLCSAEYLPLTHLQLHGIKTLLHSNSTWGEKQQHM